MAARLKLTPRRQNRVVALMAPGASLAEAARACQLTRGALYKRAERDPNFAARLEAARARQAAPVEAIDWRVIAHRLMSSTRSAGGRHSTRGKSSATTRSPVQGR